MFLLMLICTGSVFASSLSKQEQVISEAAEQVLEAPISHVTVYSDRAEVERAAQVKLEKGIHKIEIRGLPIQLVSDSLRISAEGAQLLWFEQKEIEEKPLAAEYEALIVELDRCHDEYEVLRSQELIVAGDVRTVATAKAYQPPLESDRQQPLALAPETWSSTLAFLEERQRENTEAQLQLQRQLREKAEELNALKKKGSGLLARKGTLGLRLQIVLELQQEQLIDLELSYQQLGASWIPSYELYYDSAREEVELVQAALLTQETGDAWTNVSMAFSTARPVQLRQLPQLQTWTLFEQRQFLPKAEPRKRSSQPPYFSPPVVSLTVKEQEQEKLMGHHRSELALLVAATTPTNRKEIDRNRPEYKTEYARDDLYAPPERAGMSTVALESMAVHKSKGAKGKRKESRVLKENTAVLGIEAPNLYSAPQKRGSFRPDEQAEGAHFTWSTEGLVSAPSGSSSTRVPLSKMSSQAALFYETTPAIEESAYVKAKLTAISDLPLLGGPAKIFWGGHFRADAQLDTIFSGEAVELPFGVDEQVKIKRELLSEQRKEGMLQQEEITDYKSRIEIVNHKSHSITIRVIEQLPISRNEEIKIEQQSTSHPLAQKPDREGILFWELSLKPGEKQILELEYSIAHPKGWQLRGSTR